jgi:hypothetical protein
MSYISPIKIGKISQMEEGWADKIGKYIAGEVDNLVLESCVKVGCHVDKDELEKALRYDRDQYFKGYADGKRDAASPWHRVGDELPKPGKIVLACNDVGTVNVAYLANYGKWYAANNTMYDSWTWMPNVTHWMPMPEPPKEDA